MREPSVLSFGRMKARGLLALLAMASLPAQGQQSSPANSANNDAALTQAVEELRTQIQELRATVSEMKSEAAEYRAQNEELRKQLESIRAIPNPPAQATDKASTAATPAVEQRVTSLEETTQLLGSEIRDEYQTKVESGSKYRVRLSGLVLLNLFSNAGYVDNLDFPTYAASSNLYGTSQSFGATMRQSELGLEVFGPELAGAKTSGQIQFDFGGGFPAAALDGVNSGLVRLRTAAMRLDWRNTSIVAGQDSLFVSPQSPASFASLVIPSLGYSGNLWAWTPQLRVEHRFSLAEGRSILLQGGILDNLTGEPTYISRRQVEAGESSGLPAYAVRTSWNSTLKNQPFVLGASGYYSRQNWGFDWNVDGWMAAADWSVPLTSRVALSGEIYRGKSIGGLGGAIGQSVLFSGNPTNPASDFRAVNASGGWSQIKFSATSKLDIDAAFGVDNPFSRDIHAFANPIGYYPTVLAANRSAMANFIYRPRSDLLFSAEYRHLNTAEVGVNNSAEQLNLVMGVLF